ncbi:MAG: RNA polymerase subunit sigma-70 [Bacteroidetes bacterium]|nr:MAG: RNA polymerase subunit sigma-70 [Bacteroidota bacterium]
MYTDSFEDKEDLRQEITLQLWRSFSSFKGSSKFSTWMYTVSLNTAILFLKKDKKRIQTSEITVNTPDVATTRFEDDKMATFYQAAKKLTKIERAVVFLYLEGLSHKEIALNLGLTTVNARVRLSRSKNKLRKIIDKT